MHRIYSFVSILLLLALFGTMFLWLAAHASGHHVPLKTNLYFGVVAILLLMGYFLIRKVTGNRGGD